jgi:hypothetical protein
MLWRLRRGMLPQLAATGGAAVALPVITYCGQSAGLTYTNAPIGTAAADRLVVVCVTHSRTPPRVLTAVSIAGTNGAMVASAAVGDPASEIYSRLVTTGTTATITLTFSGAVTPNAMHVFTITGLTSTTAIDTLAVSATNSPSGGIDLSSGGVLIVSASGITAANAITLTGVATADHDAASSTMRIAAAHEANTPTVTNRTITATSASTAEAIAAASWR